MPKPYLNCYTLGRSVPSMERLDFVLPCSRGQALSLLALFLNIKQILVVRRRLLPFKIPDTTLYVSRVSNNDMATFLWRTGYLKLSPNPLLRLMERWLYEYQLFRHIRRQEQTIDEVVVELFHPSQGQHPLLALEDPEHPPNDVLLARLQFTELSAEQTLLRIFIGWADLAPLVELDTLYNLLQGYIHLMTKVLLPAADNGARVGKAELTTEAVTAETVETANAALAQATPMEPADRDPLFAESAEPSPPEPTPDLPPQSLPDPDLARLDLPEEGKDAAGEERVAMTAETAETANAVLTQATPMEHEDRERLFAESAETSPSEPTPNLPPQSLPDPDLARLDLPGEGKDAAGEERVAEIGSERPFPDEGESDPRSTAAEDAPHEQQRGWPTDELGEIDWLHNDNGVRATDIADEPALLEEPGQRPLPRLPQTVSTPGDDNDTLYRYIDPPRLYPKTLSNICIMVAERQRQIEETGIIPRLDTFDSDLRPSRNTFLKIPELVSHWYDIRYRWNLITWLRCYSGHTEMEISEMLSYLYVKLDKKVWAVVTSAGKEEEKTSKNQRHRAQDERDSREKGQNLH